MDIRDRINELTATHKLAKPNKDNIAIHGCRSIADQGNIQRNTPTPTQIMKDQNHEFDLSRLKNGTGSDAGAFFLRHKVGMITIPIQTASIMIVQARMSGLLV